MIYEILKSILEFPKRGGGPGISILFVSFPDKDEPTGAGNGAITFLLKSVESRIIIYLLYS